MKTYTVKMSKSVVEHRETLINCENEEELIELLDEKIERVWSEGDETFDDCSNDEIDLIKYWEHEEFDEGARVAEDFCDRRSKTVKRRGKFASYYK